MVTIKLKGTNLYIIRVKDKHSLLFHAFIYLSYLKAATTAMANCIGNKQRSAATLAYQPVAVERQYVCVCDCELYDGQDSCKFITPPFL